MLTTVVKTCALRVILIVAVRVEKNYCIVGIFYNAVFYGIVRLDLCDTKEL